MILGVQKGRSILGAKKGSKTGPKPVQNRVQSRSEGDKSIPEGQKGRFWGPKKGVGFPANQYGIPGAQKPVQNQPKTGPKPVQKLKIGPGGPKKGQFWGPKRVDLGVQKGRPTFLQTSMGFRGSKTGPKPVLKSEGPNRSILEVQKGSIPGARKRHKNH